MSDERFFSTPLLYQGSSCSFVLEEMIVSVPKITSFRDKEERDDGNMREDAELKSKLARSMK